MSTNASRAEDCVSCILVGKVSIATGLAYILPQVVLFVSVSVIQNIFHEFSFPFLKHRAHAGCYIKLNSMFL